jgi:hypothetical protein
MIHLNYCFLLAVMSWGISDKVTNHHKLWERCAPYDPRVLCRVTLNQGGLLVMHCFPQRVAKALCQAKGKVEEDNIA